MRPISSILLLLISGSLAHAQLPVGPPTQLLGVTPRLEVEPLWVGNESYGYRITQGPPNAPGLLAVSTTRDSTVQLGIEIGVSLDPAHVISLTPFTTDGSGTAVIPRPIPGPEVPALAGQLLYAQAAVASPLTGTLGATETIQVEIRLRPTVFLTNDGLPSQLRDPYSGQVRLISPDHSGHATLALFANGGADLFAVNWGSSGTAAGLWHADILAPAPGFNLLLPAAGGSLTSLAWDPVRRRLVVETIPELIVLDGDRTSPAFGSEILRVPWNRRGLSMTADGSRLLTHASPDLVLFDFDPASLTFLQPLVSLPIVSPTPFVAFSSVRVSPDGRTGVFSQPGPVAGGIQFDRADLTTGTWIDHDQATPGIQPLGLQSVPQLPRLNFTWWSRSGRTFFTLDGAGGYLRVDFDSADLSRYVVTPSALTASQPVFPAVSTFHSLTTSERFMLERFGSGFGSATASLNLVHVETGTIGHWFTYTSDNTASPLLAVWN